MYPRILSSELKQLAKQYPVVTVTGPRQSGKTTLVVDAFPNLPYVNLEALDLREFASLDPRGFLEKYPDGAIFDEIQRVPTLLSYIQLAVDAKRQNGMYILTGSHQFELHQAITQSLAGRTALLVLLPMSLQELREANIQESLDELLLKGGFPKIYKDRLDPGRAYKNYVQTYVERDVRQIVHVKDLVQFQRFLRLLAGRVGQLVNFESLGNDVGISSHTVKEWLSILEASYLIVRLQPYYENFGKRMVKSPKIYFTDVGLASHLLGLETVEQVERDPLRGNLIENLVVIELLKARYNEGKEPNLYFFRDAHGHEVDLIYKTGNDLIPIEVKAARTFNEAFLKNLHFFQDLVGDRSPKGYIVYSGDHEQAVKNIHVVNIMNADRIIV